MVETETMSIVCVEIFLSGRVQGVGFRPYIARQAEKFKLAGWVRNEYGNVRLQIEGLPFSIECFQQELIDQAPPASIPIMEFIEPKPLQQFLNFTILESKQDATDIQLPNLPLDLFTCPQCLSEMNDPTDRRYNYPFINCTQCGPRYTIINQLPYDRVSTSMADFEMCDDCRQEYEDPHSRRFHAEPIACEKCGPQLTLITPHQVLNGARALGQLVSLLREGRVVAIKGIGGFHLVCLANNDEAINRIRHIKQRPTKPMAVLFHHNKNHSAYIGRYVRIGQTEQRLLHQVERPIVLCKQNAHPSLSSLINPGLSYIGAMLPYSPLHELVMNALDVPLVVTSANFKGEPVCFTLKQVKRLPIDVIADHNRTINFPADDSVYNRFGQPIRVGRGHSPKLFSLPFKCLSSYVGLGAEEKVTLAFSHNDQLILSPHIGSLKSPSGQKLIDRMVDHFKNLSRQSEMCFIGDCHPQYTQHSWLKRKGYKLSGQVFHHHAHASALWFDAWLQKKITSTDSMLVFAWDGSGFSPDNSIWGGEVFYGCPGQWQHVASLNEFILPGGDECISHPWRIIKGMGIDYNFNSVSKIELDVVDKQTLKNLNCFRCSSMGRLLDACASLLGIESSDYEAHAATLLNELASNAETRVVELPWLQEESGLWRLNWQPLMAFLIDGETSNSTKAATIFNSIVAAVKSLLVVLPDRSKNVVGFTGGVLQSEQLITRLFKENPTINAVFNHNFPANDASIAIGQIIEFIGSSNVEKS